MIVNVTSKGKVTLLKMYIQRSGYVKTVHSNFDFSKLDVRVAKTFSIVCAISERYVLEDVCNKVGVNQ